jgi:hypothetical protein
MDRARRRQQSFGFFVFDVAVERHDVLRRYQQPIREDGRGRSLLESEKELLAVTQDHVASKHKI